MGCGRGIEIFIRVMGVGVFSFKRILILIFEWGVGVFKGFLKGFLEVGVGFKVGFFFTYERVKLKIKTSAIKFKGCQKTKKCRLYLLKMFP